MNHPQPLLFLADFLRILTKGKVGMLAAKKLYNMGIDSVCKLVHAKDYEIRLIVGRKSAEKVATVVRELNEGYPEPFHLMSASGVFGRKTPQTLESLYKRIDATDRYSFLCALTITDVSTSRLIEIVGSNTARFLIGFPSFMEFLAQNHIVIDTKYLQ